MSDGMGREFMYLSSHATNRYFIPNWGIILSYVFWRVPELFPFVSELFGLVPELSGLVSELSQHPSCTRILTNLLAELI